MCDAESLFFVNDEQSEILELKANPNRAAEGAVIEAQLDVGRGPVATVLIQNGTLRQGDIFVVGEQYGKVRALINDKGERIKEAGPSMPVEVLGLNGTPSAGDVLNVTETDAQAREIAEYRQKAAKDKRATAGAATTLEQLMANAKANESVSELPILVKADVQVRYIPMHRASYALDLPENQINLDDQPTPIAQPYASSCACLPNKFHPQPQAVRRDPQL